MIPLNVYIATSFKNPGFEPLRDALRAEGVSVYDWKATAGFSWRDIGLSSTMPARDLPKLGHPTVRKAYHSDIDAVNACDILILLLPCGFSAHAEYGRALGVKKTIVATMSPDEVVQTETLYAGAIDYACGLEEICKAVGALWGMKQWG